MSIPAPDIASQLALRMQYQSRILQGLPLPALSETGFRAYSQSDEDGILLFLFSVLGERSKLFVEIGCEKGIQCNCANLTHEFAWHGLFVDANEDAIREGEEYYAKYPVQFCYPPKFRAAKVDRDSVNTIVSDAGFSGQIDLFSLDVDGMDYWIWQALDVIDPLVVVVEVNGKFGTRSITVLYDADWEYNSIDAPYYAGASLSAMTKLANEKGYRLVGTNTYGFNAFYVKRGEADDLLPEVSVESCRQHPTRKNDEEIFSHISHLPFVEV